MVTDMRAPAHPHRRDGTQHVHSQRSSAGLSGTYSVVRRGYRHGMSDPAGRVIPPYAVDEITMLRSYLDHHRQTFRWKTGGLSQQQLASPHPPSTLTLAGLVKHLALNEDWWFGGILTGSTPMAPFADVDFDADPDWEFRTARDDQPDHLFALWERAVAASDANIAGAADGVDTVAARRESGTGEGPTLRWILLHMIEEYARHNGHADLIRESVDGSVGE